MARGSFGRLDNSVQRLGGRVAGAIALALALTSCLKATEHRIAPANDAVVDTGWIVGDPQSGKELFVSKGCVICHSVNGIGGRAALPLDAPPDGRDIDPMVFAAAMWAGASAMLSLQYLELGYQIGLSGEELRNLAAFASDLNIQIEFSLDDVPADIRPWIIDTPHWTEPAWPERFETIPDDLTTPFEEL